MDISQIGWNSQLDEMFAIFRADGLEPGCATREAIDSGQLEPGRYGNYLKLGKEMAHLQKVLQTKKRQMTRGSNKKKRPKKKADRRRWLHER